MVSKWTTNFLHPQPMLGNLSGPIPIAHRQLNAFHSIEYVYPLGFPIVTSISHLASVALIYRILYPRED